MPRVACAAFTFILLTAALSRAPAGPAAPDRWINAHTQPAVPAMAVARYAPTATVLAGIPLRGKVLVAGGLDGNECVASARLFDPASLTWTTTGSLEQGRNFATATKLDDAAGRVLIAGGYDERLGTLASAEIYDPEKHAFRTLGARME